MRRSSRSSTVTRGNVDTPGGVGTNATPLDFTSHQYNYPSPDAWGWNLTVEQEFKNIGVFTLSYVGRRGYSPGAACQHQPAAARHHCQANPVNVKSPDCPASLQGLSPPSPKRRTRVASIYHSLQANFKRRLTKGLLFGAAYTWSKSLDYGSSNGTNLPNAYDKSQLLRSERLRYPSCAWCSTTSGTFRYGNELNQLSWRRTTLGNWQFSGTIQGQSGRPQTVSQNNDRAGVGPGSGNQLWVVSSNPTAASPVRGR